MIMSQFQFGYWHSLSYSETAASKIVFAEFKAPLLVETEPAGGAAPFRRAMQHSPILPAPARGGTKRA